MLSVTFVHVTEKIFHLSVEQETKVGLSLGVFCKFQAGLPDEIQRVFGYLLRSLNHDQTGGNSAFHPSRVGISSTGLSGSQGLRRGAFTCVRYTAGNTV